MDHAISDLTLIARLRAANDDARHRFSTTVNLIVESQALLRLATRIGSPLISMKPDGPP